MGHTEPNAAHCFCAVAFQGGVAASAFLHWHCCIGVAASAFLHWRCCIGVAALAFLHRPACIGRFCINSQLLPDAAAFSSMQGLRPAASSRWVFATVPPSSSPWHSRPAVPLQRPCQQHLPDGVPPRRLGKQETSSAPPASNKPHLAEKSTPVWLAIWHTWAGFANSQLRCAAFCCTYSYICTIPVSATLSHRSDIANLSAHLHRLPTPPPYLRRMKLSPGPWAQVSGAG